MNTYNHNGTEFYRDYPLKGLEARKAGRAWAKWRGAGSVSVDSLTMPELNAVWMDTSDALLADLCAGKLPAADKVREAEAKAESDQPKTTPRQTPSGEGLNLDDAKTLLDIFNKAKGGTAALDEGRVIDLINQYAPKPEPVIKGYEFKVDGKLAKVEGRQHAYFPLIAAALTVRQHVWLVGPAGGGKTHMVSQAAKAAGLESAAPFSVCGQTTKTDLLGFVDAQGVYRGTAFRDAYENGKVFPLDEVDNGNANVLAVLNAAFANGETTFPDRVVKRHPDFVCVACANTFGQGASALYVGRNPIDAATLDRFFFVSLPYDEGLEASFVGIEGVPSPAFNLTEGGKVPAAEWFKVVTDARKNAERAGIKAVISPRATIAGAKLAAAGVGKAWLLKGLLIKSLDSISAGKLLPAPAPAA